MSRESGTGTHRGSVSPHLSWPPGPPVIMRTRGEYFTKNMWGNRGSFEQKKFKIGEFLHSPGPLPLLGGEFIIDIHLHV